MLENIAVNIIHGPFFSESVGIARRYHLLATDAVHVAAMSKADLTDIATNDTDFSRVQFLHTWKPEER